MPSHNDNSKTSSHCFQACGFPSSTKRRLALPSPSSLPHLSKYSRLTWVRRGPVWSDPVKSARAVADYWRTVKTMRKPYKVWDQNNPSRSPFRQLVPIGRTANPAMLCLDPVYRSKLTVYEKAKKDPMAHPDLYPMAPGRRTMFPIKPVEDAVEQSVGELDDELEDDIMIDIDSDEYLDEETDGSEYIDQSVVHRRSKK